MLWIIVIIIVPTFCLFGVYFGRGKGSDIAGYVMGKKVPRWQFDDAYARWFKTNTLFGRGQEFDEQRMWNMYAIVVAADLWGIKIPDSSVVEYVKNTFAGSEGEFNLEAVEEILKNRGRGLTLPDYEQTSREMMSRTQLLGIIAGGARVTDDEARHLYRFEEGTASISLVRFKAETFEKDVTPDAGEVRHFFFRHSETYRVPEKFRFEYVGAKLKNLEKDVKLTGEEILKYYNDNKALYRAEPASEEPEADVGEEEEEDKKYKPLEEVREDIENVLRKQKVLDPAIARLTEIEQRIEQLAQTQELQAIDLEKLADEMGLMHNTTNALTDRELSYHEDIGADSAQANYLCHALDVGQPSVGIRGYTSYYVARLLEKSPSRLPDFADVEKQVAADFIRGEAAAKAFDAATNFADLAARTSLDEVVKAQDLKTENHGPFNRLDVSWTIAGATTDFAVEIFTTPVDKITPAVMCGSDTLVAKITSRNEPDWKKFDEKAGDLHLRYGRAKARVMIEQWFRSMETFFRPRKSNANR